MLNLRLLFLVDCAGHVDDSPVLVERVFELDALGVQKESLSASASIFSISDDWGAQSHRAVDAKLVFAACDRLHLEPNASRRAVRAQYALHDGSRRFPVDRKRDFSWKSTQSCIIHGVRLHERLVGLVNASVLQERRELGGRESRASKHKDAGGSLVQSMDQTEWVRVLFITWTIDLTGT